jgi:hypothetical protein
MPTGIVWPDIEAAFIAYIGPALVARPEPFASGVRVGNDQKSTPARQVIVRDDGGPKRGDVRATARIGVRVLAKTWADCADLAALVVALIDAWPDGEPVVAVASLSRGYPVADPSGIPERYVTAELVLRGVDL